MKTAPRTTLSLRMMRKPRQVCRLVMHSVPRQQHLAVPTKGLRCPLRPLLPQPVKTVPPGSVGTVPVLEWESFMRSVASRDWPSARSSETTTS